MIVTGTSPGSIGFETARILRSWGATVVGTTRADLDLADRASVARFAERFLATHERLDVLVNNAGVHLDLLSEWKAPRLLDGHEIHWRTNYLGTMDLTHALLPRLLETARSVGEARVVNVVSMLHARGKNEELLAPPARYESWKAYGNSKLALVHATQELQRRHPSLKAYSLHPGAVYTRIADKGLAGHPMLARIRRALAPIEAYFLLTPEQGAQTSVHCATAPALPGGGYFRNCGLAAPSAAASDSAVAARLWDQTLDWVRSR